MPKFTPQELCDAAAQCVKKAEPAALLEAVVACGEVTLVIQRESILPVVTALRADARLKFEMLSDVTAIDYLETGRQPRFDVVYNIYSVDNSARLRLRAAVPEEAEACWVESVTGLWAGASFMEREVWDMFGIRFHGLADHTRVLMPEDWQGHPLRKDFPLGGATSFYFKQDTDEYAGEPADLVPRIRVQDSDV